MTPLALRTEHLSIVPASVAHITAEIAGTAAFGSLIGADVPASWPPGEYDAAAQRYFLDRLMSAGADGVGWYGWYALRDQDSATPATVVGAGGFFGPPTPEGIVELGYSVCEEWRGRGYATELVRALTEYAMRQPNVTQVIAHTTALNPASIRVLERSGFAYAGAGAEAGSLRYEYRGPC